MAGLMRALAPEVRLSNRLSRTQTRKSRFHPISLQKRTAAAKQAAEKRKFLEGDGLQAVHNCFLMNTALAAEGAAFAPYSTFFQKL